jgi:hypothetical protein
MTYKDSVWCSGDVCMNYESDNLISQTLNQLQKDKYIADIQSSDI